MAPAALRKSNSVKDGGNTQPTSLLDPVGPAYETTFLEALEPALGDLARYGIRVAVNAGGSDTEKCYDAVIEMIKRKGLDLLVAWVDGDNVLEVVEKDLRGGEGRFKNVQTGESWKEELTVVGAQVCGLPSGLVQFKTVDFCDSVPTLTCGYTGISRRPRHRRSLPPGCSNRHLRPRSRRLSIYRRPVLVPQLESQNAQGTSQCPRSWASARM